MDNKLPKVFANRVSNVNNNRKFYYSLKDGDIEIQKPNDYYKFERKNKLNNVVHSADINKKIIDLFKSPNNVYKVKADIKIDGKTITKNLIGRTKDTLITLDNEIINIADIDDIEPSK